MKSTWKKTLVLMRSYWMEVILFLSIVLIFFFRGYLFSHQALLESLDRLSAPLLAIFAFFALKQLTIAKQDIVIRSTREAAAHALKQMEFFAEKLIGEMSKNQISLRGVGVFHPPADVQYFDEEEAASSEKFKKYTSSAWETLNKNIELRKAVIETANRLEALAAYFMQGVADEKIAFTSLHEMYIEYIQSTAFIYMRNRHRDRVSVYTDTIELYKLWNRRVQYLNLKMIHTITGRSMEAMAEPQEKRLPIGTDRKGH